MQLLVAMLLWVGFIAFLYLLAGLVIGTRHAIEAAASMIVTLVFAFASTFCSTMFLFTLPSSLAIPAVLAVQLGTLVLLYLIINWIVTVSRRWAH